MRARTSLVQLGLAGLWKFVVMTSAFCLAMTVAITGPPTPSETAGVNAVVNHAVRRFDSAALNLNFDLCRRAGVIAHAAGLCAAPATVVVRKDTAQPVEVAAVSQTLPLLAREILPPDTLDQIARPSRRVDLLGAAPQTSRRIASVTHPSRVAAHARASPSRNHAVASSRSRTAHASARVRRARTTPAVRTATARAHAARPPRRAPATPVRATVRHAPGTAPVVAAPNQHAPPHEEPPPVTTLDEQLERFTAPPDAEPEEPASDDEDQPPLDEKS